MIDPSTSKSLQRISWTFAYQKLAERAKPLINTACIAIKDHTGQNAHPHTRFAGRLLQLLVDDLLFIPILTDQRPPQRLMSVLDLSNGQVLLPFASVTQRRNVVARINPSTIKDVVMLAEVIACEYGIVERSSFPIQVESDSEMSTFDIHVELDFDRLDKCMSIWWQRWGGLLFSMTVAEKDDVPLKETLERRCGAYKRLPIGLLR